MLRSDNTLKKVKAVRPTNVFVELCRARGAMLDKKAMASGAL